MYANASDSSFRPDDCGIDPPFWVQTFLIWGFHPKIVNHSAVTEVISEKMVTRDLPRFYPVISVTVFHISVQTLLFSGIRRLCVSSKRSKLDRPIPLKGISFAKDVNQGVFYLGSPVRRVHPFDGFIEKTHLSSSLRNKFI